MPASRNKIVVIGAGSVGTTYIYALLQTGLADQIALIDTDTKRVEGEVMDPSHGLPFIPPVSIKAGDYCDCADARNVHAYLLGEHGDTEVPAWSMAHIAGLPLEQYCRLCRGCDAREQHQRIAAEVRDSAYHIIDYKGSTYYGIGLSLLRISAAILRNEHSVLTVSTLLQGEYRIRDICLSVPCIVGGSGIVRIVDAELAPTERDALHGSARALADVLERVAP